MGARVIFFCVSIGMKAVNLRKKYDEGSRVYFFFFLFLFLFIICYYYDDDLILEYDSPLWNFFLKAWESIFLYKITRKF